MKQLFNLFINPLTILYILIALIFNKFGFILIHYSIAFIHELFHFLMAKFLKVRVGEIEFLPIGFYLKIPNLENYTFYKQLLVLIAGPTSFIFSCAIIKLLYDVGLLSLYVLRFFFFLCEPFLRSSLNLLQYCFHFYV